MIGLMQVLGTISRGLRVALFAVAALTALLALGAWMVRTRRISPFSGLARAIRRLTDPLLEPIERRLVRSGQRVHNAPWWLLGIVIVGGLLLIALFDFLTAQIIAVTSAASMGPRGIFILLVVWTFAILRFALLICVLASWIPVSPLNPIIRASRRLTEWMLVPLRSVIPMIGMFDITPIVAWFLLGLIERGVMAVI